MRDSPGLNGAALRCQETGKLGSRIVFTGLTFGNTNESHNSANRFGGNRLNSDTRQDAVVRGISVLTPDMEVSKIGRTTGETEGIVNGCIIQRWVDNLVTTEIGVLGKERVFADIGDSGSLVVTANGDEPYGVGMLIGKNVLGSLGLVSPLWAVLEDVEAKLEQTVNFYVE